MKPSIILPTILIVFVTPFELWSQSNSDLADRLSSHFKELRMEGIPLSRISGKELLQDSWLTLELLSQYEHSANVHERSESVKFIHFIGHNSENAGIRNEVVLRLVGDCSEKESKVWQSAAEKLLSYKETDFTIDSRKILHMLLQAKPKEQVILLIGVAGMREELETLRALKNQTIWAAQLASARLGEIEDINKVIERVDRHENPITKIGLYLKDLAYTKQPYGIRIHSQISQFTRSYAAC